MNTRAGILPTLARPMAALVAAAALMLSLFALVGPALATHVEPVFVEGNPTCGDLGDYTHEFKIEPVTGGTHNDGGSGFSVEITLNSTASGPTFDWTANMAVDAVFVKGGPNGNLYEYNPAATADSGLHAPVNPSNETYYGLSHISFCFGDEPEESASPTPEESVQESVEESASPTPEESVQESVEESASPTPEQSVGGATGTPEPSLPDGAMSSDSGANPLPTVLFSLILLTSLGTLAYANVRSVRSRI